MSLQLAATRFTIHRRFGLITLPAAGGFSGPDALKASIHAGFRASNIARNGARRAVVAEIDHPMLLNTNGERP